MGSQAMHLWASQRNSRLDELLAAHETVGGTGPGRRWRTRAINGALVVSLVAEWQGYLIDLHDESSDWVVRTVNQSSPEAGALLQKLLTSGRMLNRGNAQPDNIASDFGRFGLKIWDRCSRRDVRTEIRVQHVENLLKARDGIAHSNVGKLSALENAGIRIDLRTYRTWHRAIRCLVETVDDVMAGHLSGAFSAPRPWT